MHNHVREALDSRKFIPDDIASMMKLLIACQPLTMDQMGMLRYEAAKLMDHYLYSSSNEVMSSDSEVNKHVMCHDLIKKYFIWMLLHVFLTIFLYLGW